MYAIPVHDCVQSLNRSRCSGMLNAGCPLLRFVLHVLHAIVCDETFAQDVRATCAALQLEQLWQQEQQNHSALAIAMLSLCTLSRQLKVTSFWID